MAKIGDNWLTIEEATKYFGYSHPENLRQRLRQLREGGEVDDTGNPPPEYKITSKKTSAKIVLFWLNPRMALIRDDAPRELLNPKRGKRHAPLL